MRSFPKISLPTVDGHSNPFHLVETAYLLFDQEKLFDAEKTMPMMRFQETILILMTLYKNLKVKAPSQSGKTTIAELLAATIAVTFPGSRTLILSTVEDQSKRLLLDIDEKFIQCCKLEELRKLEINSSTQLKLAANKSSIKALPHSIKAVTGNPADYIILDEIGKWDKDPGKIYAEAVVRTAKTGGSILSISAIDNEGFADDQTPEGFRGGFYDYIWTSDWVQRRTPDDSNAAAINFTYHVSPYLVKNHDRIKRELKKAGRGYYEAHMLGVPRKSSGVPIFQNTFKPDIHVVEDEVVREKINPQQPLFLCFDPGNNKAAVLGQLDPVGVRLTYLRAWMDLDTQFFGDFVKSVWMQVNREFAEYGIDLFADTASKQTNSITDTTFANIIQAETGEYPIMEYQHVEPGITLMESFMKRVDGFFVSTKANLLIDAFSTGLVRQERLSGGGEKKYLLAYKKDGFYEHVGDAARYPVHILTNGQSAQSLSYNTRVIIDYTQQPHQFEGFQQLGGFYYD